jgi:hypothetical protein
MTLADCTPGTRVRCPGHICGKIVRVSLRLRFSVLVRRDDGGVLAYRLDELTKLEPKVVVGGPVP